MDRVANEPCHGWTASSLYLICVMEEKQRFGKSEKFRFLHHHRLRIQRNFSTESSPLIGDACSRLDWCLQTATGGWTLNKSPMTPDTLICVRKVVIIGPDVPLFTDESSENCRVLMTDFHSTLSRVALGRGAARCDNSDRQFYKCTTQQAATS